MWNRKELKANARQRLSVNYWMCVLVALILLIVSGGISFSYRFDGGDISRIVRRSTGALPTAGAVGNMMDAAGDVQNAAGEVRGAMNEAGLSTEDIERVSGEVIDTLKSLGVDEDHSAQLIIDGQQVFSIAEDGITAENQAQFEKAFENFAKSFVNSFSAADWTKIWMILLPIIIVMVIIGIFVAAIAICVKIFLLNPLANGCKRFFMKNHDEKAAIGNVGFAFAPGYLNVVKVNFLMNLFIFLWGLLFIIPGVIKSYEYRMIPYLLAENPDMDQKEAFARSREMMTGNKWRAFVLDLSFIGWGILSLITFGLLGLFYVNPYMFQTEAELYFALNGREKAETNEQTGTYESYVEV